MKKKKRRNRKHRSPGEHKGRSYTLSKEALDAIPYIVADQHLMNNSQAVDYALVETAKRLRRNAARREKT